MKYLTLQERVDFVNEVIQLCTVSGEYQSALFDLIFRVVARKYYLGTDYLNIPQSEWPEFAYENWESDFLEKVNIDELNGMKDACLERAAVEQTPLNTFLVMAAGILGKMEKNLDGIDMGTLTEDAKSLSRIPPKKLARAAIQYEKIKEKK